MFRDKFLLEQDKVTFSVKSQDVKKPGVTYYVQISKPKAIKAKGGRSPLRRYPGKCSCRAATEGLKVKNSQVTRCTHVATVYGHFFSNCD